MPLLVIAVIESFDFVGSWKIKTERPDQYLSEGLSVPQECGSATVEGVSAGCNVPA